MHLGKLRRSSQNKGVASYSSLNEKSYLIGNIVKDEDCNTDIVCNKICSSLVAMLQGVEVLCNFSILYLLKDNYKLHPGKFNLWTKGTIQRNEKRRKKKKKKKKIYEPFCEEDTHLPYIMLFPKYGNEFYKNSMVNKIIMGNSI
ncbi:folate transporter 1, putative (FT1) [Plasmodium ovale curtisi]|uniref:Folate transporter 1, putative (FT1) n=1 Tax=Plasmodium ovale curtisi TaxID=864141 RepID=A0A1A8VSF2_PLAOA|nr:folate transporter 1, putative (FT1) [Plasmodium ovale curtisi]